MNIYQISIIIFVVYAPISVVLRNISNKIINDKKEIWTIKNNDEMMKMLKNKNKKLYYLMQLEKFVCIQLMVLIIIKVIL